VRSTFRRSIRALGLAALIVLAPAAACANAAVPGTPIVPEPTLEQHVPVHGEPEIRGVEWGGTSQALHPGSQIEATVITSDNVAYVEARVRYWNLIFRNTAPGRFQLRYRVPLLPPMALGNWQITLIAHSIDGVEVKRTFEFAYRYF
jgi:hypothetical protein